MELTQRDAKDFLPLALYTTVKYTTLSICPIYEIISSKAIKVLSKVPFYQRFTLCSASFKSDRYQS